MLFLLAFISFHELELILNKFIQMTLVLWCSGVTKKKKNKYVLLLKFLKYGKQEEGIWGIEKEFNHE